MLMHLGGLAVVTGVAREAVPLGEAAHLLLRRAEYFATNRGVEFRPEWVRGSASYGDHGVTTDGSVHSSTRPGPGCERTVPRCS
jgi:hypothetical protein